MRDNWLSLRSGSEIRGYASPHDGHAVQMTKELAECIGYAFALWLANEMDTTPDKLTIAVGQDSRLSSPHLAKALIHGLTCADCDVYDCSLSTTPAMFLTMFDSEVAADGAVMVSSSHAPGHINGFKLFYAGDGLDAEEITQVIQSAMQITLPHRLVTGLDCQHMYAETIRKMVYERLETDVQCPLLGLSVVVDAANGAGGFFAALLEELGADVTGSMYLEPNGHFPGHVPDPEMPESIELISRAVIENEADLGVTFDSDGVRASIVDQTGKPITGNRLIALVSAILLEDDPGATIVTDSVTSSGLARFITEWGGVHYRFKRGYRNVIDEAVRLNEEGIDCPLAIETSGHAALREHFFIDDGMYLATWLIIEALYRKREGLTLSSLIDELQEPVESVRIRMQVLGEDVRESAAEVIQVILSHTLENQAWHLAPDNREGARISFDLDGGVENAWFMLRLSVHDPVMALHAESDEPGGVKRMLTELYEVLRGTEELDLSVLKHAIQ
ncbi:phosphomannomutase/phosphoglucomutase [Eubacteriales bacterium OttesenSCG-928-N13]|nr:phosphomannomutase/phosphoglucomutase [Eubacteriales bacterium OttesenSCG-928-N13]